MKSQKRGSHDPQCSRKSSGVINNAPEFEDTAVIYVRNGSDADYTASLEHQEHMCREACEENGMEILEVFRDDGESANELYRPGLVAAMAYCRENHVDGFVATEITRLARSVEVYQALENALLDRGVEILFANIEHSTDCPAYHLHVALLESEREPYRTGRGGAGLDSK